MHLPHAAGEMGAMGFDGEQEGIGCRPRCRWPRKKAAKQKTPIHSTLSLPN